MKKKIERIRGLELAFNIQDPSRPDYFFFRLCGHLMRCGASDQYSSVETGGYYY